MYSQASSEADKDGLLECQLCNIWKVEGGSNFMFTGFTGAKYAGATLSFNDGCSAPSVSVTNACDLCWQHCNTRTSANACSAPPMSVCCTGA